MALALSVFQHVLLLGKHAGNGDDEVVNVAFDVGIQEGPAGQPRLVPSVLCFLTSQMQEEPDGYSE